MFLTVECPDELLGEMSLPPMMTTPGVLLEKVEDVPAGPWLASLGGRSATRHGSLARSSLAPPA